MRAQLLWRLRKGVAASLVLAFIVAVWSIGKVSLFPPSLEPRALEMATASTHVVVDTPRSQAIDLRQDTYSVEGLRNRAVLLGNVMTSAPIVSYVAHRAGVPPEAVDISAPLTPEQPRIRVDARDKRGVRDAAKLNDQYRINIQANPTVAILDIYSQAPTAQTAERLANAAVDGLRIRLAALAESQQTPDAVRLRLVQLGRAEGGVINRGINWQVAVLAFFLTFIVCCATVVWLSRAVTGWRLESSASDGLVARPTPLPWN
jgi:hypothetical protein